VNDLFTTDAVEDRLRRTLRFRAEDMASGDLAGDGSRVAASSRPAVRPVELVPLAPPSAGRSTTHRRRFVAAAVLLLFAGAAGSVVLVGGGGDGGRVINSQAPTSAGQPAPESDAGAGAEASAPVMTSYPIGEYEGGGYRIHAQFDAGITTDPMSQSDLSEPVQAGDHQGFYVALPNESISELHLVVDGGMVVLRGGSLPRDQLIAAGATVTLDPATGLYAMPAPPGWTTLWTTPPDWGSPDPEAADDPSAIGRLVDPTAPDARNVSVIWYRGWDVSTLPEGATEVEVGGQAAYVGSIAPEFAEGLQLWVVHDDGVVELQGVGLSSDELVTIAAGVHRTPGTEEFQLSPPAGFVPAGP
jgi:hypothetical protein